MASHIITTATVAAVTANSITAAASSGYAAGTGGSSGKHFHLANIQQVLQQQPQQQMSESLSSGSGSSGLAALTRGGEMEKAARKLFDACCGHGGVMMREDVAKVCQELQLSSFADQIAEEMGAGSPGGVRFEQFLAWYRSTLDDEMAASSKASTPSTGETTSSSMLDGAGSDIFDRELMHISEMQFPAAMAGTAARQDKAEPAQEQALPVDAAAAQAAADMASAAAVAASGVSSGNGEADIARKVVQDLISSVDMTTTDLSELATKIHQVTIKSLKTAVNNLQHQLSQAHGKISGMETTIKQTLDDRAQLISNYERQIELCSSDIEDLRQQCCALRGQLKVAEEEKLAAVETVKTEMSKQQALPQIQKAHQGPCPQCHALNDKLAALTSQVDVALTIQSHIPSQVGSSAAPPPATDKKAHSRRSSTSNPPVHLDERQLQHASQDMYFTNQAGVAMVKSKSVSKIENAYLASTPDDDLSVSLKVSTLTSSPSRAGDVTTYQDRAAEWLQQQDSHLPVSPAHSGVPMQRQAELSQLVGEQFNAGQIDQLDTALRQCASIDDIIRAVSVHTTAYFEQELKHSQLENERLESQMMCQEAEMNVLSVTLAESKDMADRLALQTRQLQNNNEVLELAYESSLQRQHIFQLLLEASDLKALRMAIKVSRDIGCLPDDVAALPTLTWIHGMESNDFHDLHALSSQLHTMEGNLFQRIHNAFLPGNQESPHSGSPLFDDQLTRRLAHIAGRATPSSELRTRPPSVNSHGASIDEESSIADSGHQSMLHSYASRNHSYSLPADLMRLQHIAKDLKEQQESLVTSLAPVEILCNVTPSRTSSDLTNGRTADELAVLFQQVVAENAVLLQDLAILVQDKANLKKRLYNADTTMAQLQQQARSWQSREQALMTRHQQLLGELSSQRQRKMVLERELENVRFTLASAKNHFAAQSEREGLYRMNPSRRSSSCRHLTAPASTAALQSNASRCRTNSP
eukprot:scpid18070/ scgid5295/ 